jgi:outer membrane protein assembly factor BamD
MVRGLRKLILRAKTTKAGQFRILQVFSALMVLAFFAQGCASSEETALMTLEQRFQLGMQNFKDEDYLQAYDEFRIVTLQYSGSALADDAQYYMGECRFMRQEYILAAYEYQLLVQTMPTSEYVAKARYKRALCYYTFSEENRPYHLEQDETRQAIDEFQTFIEYHPTDSLVLDAEAKITELNTKLARKEFENGITYMKMEYYKSAVNSFDHVLEKYHDTPYAERAQLKKAEAMMRRNRHNEALQEIEKFFSKYRESSLKGEAEELRKEILSRLSHSSAAAFLMQTMHPMTRDLSAQESL